MSSMSMHNTFHIAFNECMNYQFVTNYFHLPYTFCNNLDVFIHNYYYMQKLLENVT